MKYNFIKAIIPLAALLIASCDSKQDPLHELQDFRTEIKEHCAEYTESDWEDAMDKYVKICHKLDDMRFTREEQLEINEIKGEIIGYAATVFAQDVSDDVMDMVEEMSSFTEGFSKTFQTPKYRRK